MVDGKWEMVSRDGVILCHLPFAIYHSVMRLPRLLLSVCLAWIATGLLVAQSERRPGGGAEKWVQATLRKMPLEEQVGQMLVSSFQSSFLSTDSRTFDELARAVHEYHIGGFHVFGASEPVPN